MDNGCLESVGAMGQCFQNSFGYHWDLGGQIQEQGLCSWQGLGKLQRSWVLAPPTHVLQASEGDQFRPTKPSRGATLLRDLKWVQGYTLPTGQQRVQEKDIFTARHCEPCIPGRLLCILMLCRGL